MAEPKFTKGPWKAEGGAAMRDGGSTKKHPCFDGKITGKRGQPIVQTSCLLGVQGRTPKEAEANARLIAAAPSMCEALKTWEKFWDTMPKGQMGKLTFDVGLFNDGFIQMARALKLATKG